MSDVPPKLAGLKIEHQQDNLRISWPTLGRIIWIVLTPLALAMGFPLQFEFDSIRIYRHPGEILLLVFLALIFLGCLYTSLVSLFNRSVIQISQRELQVKHSPLPYAPSKTFDTANIKQVYVRLIWVGRTPFHALYIITKHNRHEKLLTAVNGELALYLEEEIEHFLGIKDQVVRGE